MRQDKRITNRIPTKIIAGCEKNTSGFPAFEHYCAFTKDLSLEGVRLAIPKEIDVGEHIDLILKIPTSFLPLLIISKVVWSRNIAPDMIGKRREIELGIKFLGMSSFDREKLEEFLAVKTRGLEMSNA